MDPTAAGQPVAAGPMNVKVGQAAPDFTLPMYPSGQFTLSSARGHTAVVLYFYPQDDTPGCTAQACAFRDSYSEFEQYGADIYGISQDALDSHAAFSQKFSLPFPLLVDEGNRVRELYGMPDQSVERRARVTYVIDRDGVVRHIVGTEPEKPEVEEHIRQALAWVKRLEEEHQSA